MPDDNRTPIMVTTEHRGVFFGYYVGDPAEIEKEKIEIEGARMCVKWSSQMQGVLGLAQTGPDDRCRITPAVDKLTLFDLTGVAEVTEEAAAAWEEEPWS